MLVGEGEGVVVGVGEGVLVGEGEGVGVCVTAAAVCVATAAAVCVALVPPDWPVVAMLNWPALAVSPKVALRGFPILLSPCSTATVTATALSDVWPAATALNVMVGDGPAPGRAGARCRVLQGNAADRSRTGGVVDAEPGQDLDNAGAAFVAVSRGPRLQEWPGDDFLHLHVGWIELQAELDAANLLTGVHIHQHVDGKRVADAGRRRRRPEGEGASRG